MVLLSRELLLKLLEKLQCKLYKQLLYRLGVVAVNAEVKVVVWYLGTRIFCCAHEFC